MRISNSHFREGAAMPEQGKKKGKRREVALPDPVDAQDSKDWEHRPPQPIYLS
jgi:hypothetical protein